jgi:hypothetical protein
MPKENEKPSTDAKSESSPAASPGSTNQSSGQASRSPSLASPSQQTCGEGPTDQQDAISLLKADHHKVEGLFRQYQSADERAKADLVQQICSELIVHTMLEEEIFYPASRQGPTESLLDEAQVEHDSAKVLILDLLSEVEELRDAKVKVLTEQITTHIKEEEGPQGLFAKAQKAGINTAKLGAQLAQRKKELMAQAERDALPSPRLVSLHPFHNQPAQENRMARQSNDRDRDDRGRFTSDDDYGGRSYSTRGGYGGQERDQRGRFADDDDGRSRSYGARGGNGDQDRDQRGRFTSDDDDRGYRSRSRDDDDNRGRLSGRGQGGWFGDSEGHAEASRRGWDERSGSSGRSAYRDDAERQSNFSSRDDDDRGRSSGGRGQGGWFGDSEGHSRAAREGWEDRDRGSRSFRGDEGRSFAARGGGGGGDRDYDDDRGRPGSRGQGGWFGDSEGHSQAAREGWEDRDRGGSRSRGRNDDDRGGGDRDRGHGGWFGDSEGHSEASRRGWERR